MIDQLFMMDMSATLVEKASRLAAAKSPEEAVLALDDLVLNATACSIRISNYYPIEITELRAKQMRQVKKSEPTEPGVA